MLIQQLNGSHQGSADRFYRTLYESLLDSRLLTSSKQALYLNLLFRALRADLNVKRVKAFAKRLLQVVTMHQPAFACGTLYLLRELEGVFANLHAFIDQAEEGDSDEEENFQDLQEDGDDPRAQAQEDIEMEKPARYAARRTYDGRKRDPEHSNAESSCLWELVSWAKKPFGRRYTNRSYRLCSSCTFIPQ
jgi:ribosome biogenesis protein MAK21